VCWRGGGGVAGWECEVFLDEVTNVSCQYSCNQSCQMLANITQVHSDIRGRIGVLIACQTLLKLRG